MARLPAGDRAAPRARAPVGEQRVGEYGIDKSWGCPMSEPPSPVGAASAGSDDVADVAGAALNIPITAVTSEAFTVAARTGVAINALGSWDVGLARPPRVLVPIDVQALVVTT